MKLKIVGFIGLILMISCVTEKKCLQKFPPTTETIIRVVTRDSIVYRDTITTIFIPGQTRNDSIFIPCPPPPKTYIPDTAYARTSLATARAWWSYPVIALELVQKDSILTVRIDSAIKEAYHWRNEYENITKVVREKYVPKAYRTALNAWIIIFVAVGLVVLYKFRKKIFKSFPF